MTFMWQPMLFLFALLPILILAYTRSQRRQKMLAAHFGGAPIQQHRAFAMIMLAVGLMIMGAARPVAITQIIEPAGAVIVAIDVSGSMDRDDMPLSRLETAKASAARFIEKLQCRVGIVAFGDVAALVQAPTEDKDEAIAALQRLKIEGNTAIGSAILASVEAAAEFSPATIVLLTDGQNNTGPLPMDAAKIAEERGIRIFTIGIGTRKDIIQPLDETTLRDIAWSTGGEYYRAGDETELDLTYRGLIPQMQWRIKRTEITFAFAGAGLILLLASLFVH